MDTEIIKAAASLLEVTITVIGFVLAIKEYYKNKRNKSLRLFADQITAYYYEEQEAMKWIESLSDKKIPKLQQQLRKRAAENENNAATLYPKMTPKQAESYLC